MVVDERSGTSLTDERPDTSLTHESGDILCTCGILLAPLGRISCTPRRPIRQFAASTPSNKGVAVGPARAPLYLIRGNMRTSVPGQVRGHIAAGR